MVIVAEYSIGKVRRKFNMKRWALVSIILVGSLCYSTLSPPSPLADKLLESGIAEAKETKTTARKCEVPVDRSESVVKFHSRSQDGEDKILLEEFFRGLCYGTYLEMGGLDGILFSNSHLYNKALGWSGVLVEAGPKNFEKMQRNRPHEIATVHAAVCGERKMVHFVDVGGAVSGIWEFSSESFREQWWPGLDLNNGTAVAEVECSPLSDILSEHAPNTTHYDFFSLDIEGGELDALLSLDFSRVGFGIIFAEADEHNGRKNVALRTFLQKKGYTFLYRKKRSDWFINNNFDSIYEDLIHI